MRSTVTGDHPDPYGISALSRGFQRNLRPGASCGRRCRDGRCICRGQSGNVDNGIESFSFDPCKNVVVGNGAGGTRSATISRSRPSDRFLIRNSPNVVLSACNGDQRLPGACQCKASQRSVSLHRNPTSFYPGSVLSCTAASQKSLVKPPLQSAPGHTLLA